MRALIILVFLVFFGAVIGVEMFSSQFTASLIFPIAMISCAILHGQIILLFSDKSNEDIVKGFKLITYCFLFAFGYSVVRLLVLISKHS